MSKTTSQDIKATLWKAAGTFRGTIDAANYKDFVLSMLFLKYLDDMFNTMRSDDQRLRLKQVTEPDRFPGDIIGMALIHQSVRYLSKYLAAQKGMKRLDYLVANRGTIIELLNKHVTLLNLGKEIC